MREKALLSMEQRHYKGSRKLVPKKGPNFVLEAFYRVGLCSAEDSIKLMMMSVYLVEKILHPEVCNHLSNQ